MAARTGFGEFANGSIYDNWHAYLAQGLFYQEDHTNFNDIHLFQGCRQRTWTHAAAPVIGGLVAPLGIALALTESVMGPLFVLCSLPFALCSHDARVALEMGARSCVVGPVMLVAYLGMLIFGQTIGWLYCLVEGMPLDLLLHGRPD